jgi:hypothetical protein|eukprot:COSAG06_NODE_38606_length_421_cov_2.552795_1_plen_108_part_00
MALKGRAVGLLSLAIGQETRPFAPFMYKNDHFTKTGSGQTWGKLKKGRASAGSNVPGTLVFAELAHRVGTYTALRVFSVVPAPANISMTTCPIQTGWSPHSERPFER